jgi:hypothetical protein
MWFLQFRVFRQALRFALRDQGLKILDLHFRVNIERTQRPSLLVKGQRLIIAPLFEERLRFGHDCLESSVLGSFLSLLLRQARPLLRREPCEFGSQAGFRLRHGSQSNERHGQENDAPPHFARKYLWNGGVHGFYDRPANRTGFIRACSA